MVISLEQYNNAVSIVLAYHKQIETRIKIIDDLNGYKLSQFWRDNKHLMSARLRNSLGAGLYHNDFQMSKLKSHDLLKFKNFGKNTLTEFIELTNLLNLNLKL